MDIHEIHNCDIENLEDYLQNASIGIHIVAPGGMIIWANDIELENLGYKPEEYIGHNIVEFHHSRGKIEDILFKLTHGQTLHNYEAQIIKKDGSLSDVLICSNVYRKNGEFVHTRCFTTDVTEIKKKERDQNELERKLKNSKEQYKYLIEATNTAYIIMDTNLKILEANKVYVDVMACQSENQVVNKHPSRWVHTDYIDRYEDAFENVLDGDDISGLEIAFLTQTGDLVYTKIDASLVRNGVDKVFCLITNITKERNESKTRFIKKQKKKDKIKQSIDGIRNQLKTMK
jgi:PAS domain S-box-containing protein